jgi:Ca2+-binding RTX toxin-like protein
MTATTISTAVPASTFATRVRGLDPFSTARDQGANVNLESTHTVRRPAAALAGVIAISIAWLLLVAAPDAEAKPRCFGKKATKVGTNGGDRLTGSPRKDVIVARGGDDVVQAKSNDDRVCLGDGDDFAGTSRGFDKIDGGDGNDEMHGGGFSGRRDPGDGDRILGGEGNDFLDGTRGELKDKVKGGPGDDFLQGGEVADGGDGNDEIHAEGHVNDSHLDRVFGGPGNDTIDGDQDGSENEIHGGSGDDELNGGPRDDRLFGDEDDDGLFGFGGNDELDGGLGIDTCDQGAGAGAILNCEP